MSNAPATPSLSHRLLRCTLALIAAASISTAAIADVGNLYRIDDGSFKTHVQYQRTTLQPGAEMTLGELVGPGKVTYLYFTDDSHAYPNEGTGTTYQGLVLKIYWDDALTPSVQVPLWSFFGAFARKTIDYQSSVMQINHHCYMSYLPMPFSKRARFVLANDGDGTYSRLTAWGIDYERNAALINEKSRLHAAWYRSNPTRNAEHTLLEVKGKGHYIGNFLQVNSNYGGWWGEGDTIFDVDGSQMTHSPGTEDEYGSTWGFEKIFSFPDKGYIQMDAGQNRMYRWYFANPIRFQKSLRVWIQNQRFQLDKKNNEGASSSTEKDFLHGQTQSSDDYTSMALWYQEGAQPAPKLLPYRERIAPSKGSTYSTKN